MSYLPKCESSREVEWDEKSLGMVVVKDAGLFYKSLNRT